MDPEQTLGRIMELYSNNDFPELHGFLDTLRVTSKFGNDYNAERHNNDEQMKTDINDIVDSYYIGKRNRDRAFTVKDSTVQYRKDFMFEYIKKARDDMHYAENNYCRHNLGGACDTSEELHGFYGYVYGAYYDLIGLSWKG